VFCAHVETETERKPLWNYYQLFQLVLQAQADSLIKLGFNPVVKVTSIVMFAKYLTCSNRIVSEQFGSIS